MSMKNTKKILFRWILYGVTLCVIIALFASIESGNIDGYSLETFQVKDQSGYGYSISKEGKTFIYQPFVPGIPTGTKAFNTADEAKKVGKLVLQRLKEGKSGSITKKD